MIAAIPETDVRSTLRQFILHNFYIANPANLSDDASLLDSGIIDSTGVLELVGFLEHDLGLTMADSEIIPENLDSVSRLAAFVQRKRRG